MIWKDSPDEPHHDTGGQPVSATDTEPLRIQEQAATAPVVQDDGTVLLHLIRPCVGKGKGRHLYQADMLEANAHKFGGWRMYVDHETDAERRARGGLPRSVKDLGGIVLESHWDPSVPAEGRFGAGAVIGKVRPIKAVGDLVALHPSLVESSINARATGVRPVNAEGGRALLVEGIEDKGSVDWVTEGGAGGKVASLREAIDSSTPEDQELALLESMTDEELRAHLLTTRPSVLREASASDPDGDGDDDSDELAALIKKYKAKGLSDALAKNAATRELKNKGKSEVKEGADPAADPAVDPEGGDVARPTTEDITEALQAPEVKTVITDLIEAAVNSRMATERAAIRAEAFTDAERQIELRDLRDAAHTQIREARLPAEFERRALAQFAITSDGPTDALDVFEAYDENNVVTATAEAVLRESVDAVIADSRALVGSLRPTRVRGAGAQAAVEGEGKTDGAETRDHIGDATRALLQEANIDPDKAFVSDHALVG